MRIRREELEKFAQETGKNLTPLPITLEIRNISDNPTDTHGNAIDGLIGARLMKFETFTVTRGIGIQWDTRYVIVLSNWFYKLFKNRPRVLKKIILHELTHIVYAGHSVHFQEYAKKLGAEEFSTGSTELFRGIDSPALLKLLILLGLGKLLVDPQFLNDNRNDRGV
jgi:hypothetical protein